MAGQDVAIIPNAAATDGLYIDNRLFALQWAAGRADRALVEVASSSTIEAAIKTAAPKAAKGPDGLGRRIYLFVGHAGAGGERAETQSSFDTVPETGSFAKHTKKVTADAVALAPLVDSGRLVATNPDSATPSIKIDGVGYTGDADLVARYKIYRMLWRASSVITTNKVAQVVIASCAMGNDSVFMQNLASVLKARVGAYKQLVAVGGVQDKKTKAMVRQIWLAPTTAKTTVEIESHGLPSPSMRTAR